MNSNMQVHKYTKSGPPSHLNNCAYLKGTNIWPTFGVVGAIFCFDPMGGEDGGKFVWREQRTLCRVSDCLFLMSKSSPICHSHLQHHHRILNHHQHSNNITVIDIVTITIVYSVFTIAFSSLSFVEGSCRKQEEKLLWIVWTDPDPNDTNDTNVQCTIYNLQSTIYNHNLQSTI